jgi:hypothetical protein
MDIPVVGVERGRVRRLSVADDESVHHREPPDLPGASARERALTQPSVTGRPLAQPPARTPRRDRKDSTDQRESADRRDPTDSQEPTEPIDRTDPMLATEATEPTLPIDSTDPFEPIDSTESSDHDDHRDDGAPPRFFVIAPPSPAGRLRR